MATLKNSARRLAIAGGFALAVAAAPAVAAFTVPSIGPAPAVAECAPGEVVNTAGEISNSLPGDANSLPEVQGIPCTGANTGTCIGLQENQPLPNVEPHSSISSSP